MLHFGKLNFLFGLHSQKLTFQFQVKSSLFHLFNAATEISDENLAIKVNRWAIFRALYHTSIDFADRRKHMSDDLLSNLFPC